MGISLKQPAIGSTNWGTDVNNNWAAIQGARAIKNVLINPRFRYWQRGTSFSASGYTADRWKFTLAGTATVSRQAFTVGSSTNPSYEPQYYLQINQSVSGSSTIEQRVEGVRTFAGLQVTLSFWAYFSSGSATNITPQIVQSFGTGGTPSSSVTTAFSAVNVGTSAWGTKFSVTVTLPSLNGKTLGTNGDDYLSVQFPLPNSTYTLNISDVQLEEGAASTPIELRLDQQELALCQRYFCKSFDVDHTPTNSASGGDDSPICAPSLSGATSGLAVYVPFPVEMRKPPQITFYGYGSNATGQWRSQNNSGTLSHASTINVGTRGGTFLDTAAAVSSDFWFIHFTAEADL